MSLFTSITTPTPTTMKRILLLLCIVVLLQQSSSAKFSANSFVVTGQGGTNFILELSINGTRLSQTTLPGKQLIRNGFQPRLDTTGTLTLAVMFDDDASNPGEFLGYIYPLNSEGDFIGETSFSSGQSNAIGAAAMNGTDIWACYENQVAYIQRGDTSATTANIINDASPFIWWIQLVGTRLYVLSVTTIKFMDPVITTGTSTLTTLNGVASSNYFYFLQADTLYAQTGSDTITKYSVNGDQATELYSVTITLNAQNLNNVHALTVNGTTYIIVVVKSQVTGGTTLVRFTDNGSAFIESINIYDGPDNYLLVGPSPRLTCSDGFKNQDETDVDCGGTVCGKCLDDKRCSVDSDCVNDYCDAENICATPTCIDQVKNGLETDIDCGGLNCSACVVGRNCSVNSDCLGNACNAGICAATCADGIQNQQETDVDCGGPNCNVCLNGKKCLDKSDCESDYCNPSSKCYGFLNNNETDIDCGGSDCSPCALNKACMSNSDCESNTCTGNLCVNAPGPSSVVPINGPSTSTQPSSTPIRQIVSTGTVVELSLIGLFFGVTVLIA